MTKKHKKRGQKKKLSHEPQIENKNTVKSFHQLLINLHPITN